MAGSCHLVKKLILVLIIICCTLGISVFISADRIDSNLQNTQIVRSEVACIHAEADELYAKAYTEAVKWDKTWKKANKTYKRYTAFVDSLRADKTYTKIVKTIMAHFEKFKGIILHAKIVRLNVKVIKTYNKALKSYNEVIKAYDKILLTYSNQKLPLENKTLADINTKCEVLDRTSAESAKACSRATEAYINTAKMYINAEEADKMYVEASKNQYKISKIYEKIYKKYNRSKIIDSRVEIEFTEIGTKFAQAKANTDKLYTEKCAKFDQVEDLLINAYFEYAKAAQIKAEVVKARCEVNKAYDEAIVSMKSGDIDTKTFYTLFEKNNDF